MVAAARGFWSALRRRSAAPLAGATAAHSDMQLISPASASAFSTSSSSSSSSSSSAANHVVIALGSNLGDRPRNLIRGLELLHEKGAVQVTRHSCLYESAAAYITDQPSFLNAAVLGTTELPPELLLKALKDTEAQLGRDFTTIRYGPRPLDLDIIFYGGDRWQSPILEIPHPRCEERDFVMAPVVDLLPSQLSEVAPSWASELPRRLVDQMQKAASRWQAAGGKDRIGQDGLCRVVPLHSRRPSNQSLLKLGQRTHLMGILNVTPDSFSDGGRLEGHGTVLEAAVRMLCNGATILDIGGQSTRPGAERLSPETEADRVLPVIEEIRTQLPEAVISVDTFYHQVARRAVEAGADIVNDVSGGALDEEMHAAVAAAGVPYVLMHMRGDPTTMQSNENTRYNDVVGQVAQELNTATAAAIEKGVSPWHLILDPGIGFAKQHNDNFRLIKDLPQLRDQLAVLLPHAPLLVGPSRKGFLGTCTGRKLPADRDPATAAALCGCVAGGADIVRVHNVAASLDAARVADAIWRPV